MLLAVLAAFALAGVGGCGEDAGEDPLLRIYVLTPSGDAGERTLAAARLAIADAGGSAGGIAVEIVPAPLGDDGSGWRSASVGAAARTATEDSTAIALIGPGGAEAAFSAPITNGAGMLELIPGPVPERFVRERPGGDGVPERYQPSGARTLGALGLTAADLRRAGGELTDRLAGSGAGAGQPGTAVIGAYAATLVVLDAIGRAADPLSRESVREAYLAAASSPTPLGELSVDPVGIAGFR